VRDPRDLNRRWHRFYQPHIPTRARHIPASQVYLLVCALSHACRMSVPARFAHFQLSRWAKTSPDSIASGVRSADDFLETRIGSGFCADRITFDQDRPW
jgi:hypothetical protein